MIKINPEDRADAVIRKTTALCRSAGTLGIRALFSLRDEARTADAAVQRQPQAKARRKEGAA